MEKKPNDGPDAARAEQTITFDSLTRSKPVKSWRRVTRPVDPEADNGEATRRMVRNPDLQAELVRLCRLCKEVPTNDDEALRQVAGRVMEVSGAIAMEELTAERELLNATAAEMFGK